jgi:hypothetical protein
MSDCEAQINRLLRSNRIWKALAMAACLALFLWALVGFAAVSRQRIRAEQALRDAQAALVKARWTANAAQPR